jgi:hypothetical protein
MTTILKSHKTDDYYIALSLDFRGYGEVYSVEICPRTGANTCGYPIRSMTYSVNDKKKALATFNRYKRICK